jgi:hypothetical protein
MSGAQTLLLLILLLTGSMAQTEICILKCPVPWYTGRYVTDPWRTRPMPRDRFFCACRRSLSPTLLFGLILPSEASQFKRTDCANVSMLPRMRLQGPNSTRLDVKGSRLFIPTLVVRLGHLGMGHARYAIVSMPQ